VSGRRSRQSRPPRSSRDRASSARRPATWSIVGALVLAVACGSTFFLWFPRLHAGGVGRNVDVEISPLDDDDAIVAKLSAAGVVDRPHLFTLWLRVTGGLHALPGRHLLADDLSPLEVVRRLRRSGDATRVKVVVPEGLHRFDIAKRMHDKRACDASDFLAATSDASLLGELGIHAPTAEGWLFPATYTFAADADARTIARAMLSQAQSRVDKAMRDNAAGADDLQRTLGWGAAEIVTLASIVEKEAAVDDERPIIASVFLNRLRDPTFVPHRLQADPTAAYGCLAQSPPTSSCVGWLAAGGGRPSAEIEHDPDDAWSTYTHDGLPPTPIANPGEASIVAVLAPAKTKYLYFVAKGGGRHTFSESLAAHDQAVKAQP
jgi:UPF0755 protein